MLTQVETHRVCPPSSPPSSLQGEDADLTLQLRRNELTDLVVTEKNHFQRIAFSILRDRTEAEDVVHTAFCAAWMAMGRFRGDSSIKTWFTRIVANRAILALRKLRRKTTGFEQSFSSAVEDPEKIAARREAVWLVRRHLADLPAEARIMVTLHFFNDCSLQQVAELRGKSRPSVKAHLHRGKALLRKSICKGRGRPILAAR